MTAPPAAVRASTWPCLWVCPSWGYAGDGLHSARLELCCSVPCCLSPPLPGLLCLCGLASGPLLLSLSFNSPLSICAWSIPNLMPADTSSQTWPCFQPPPARSLACTGCLLGSGACLSALLTSLGNWSLASASRDCPAHLCTEGYREEHPPLGPVASSQRQRLGLLSSRHMVPHL